MAVEDIRAAWKRHIGVSPHRLDCGVEEFINNKYPDMDVQDRAYLSSRLNRHYNKVLRGGKGRPSRLPPVVCKSDKPRRVGQFITVLCSQEEHDKLARLLRKSLGKPRFFRIVKQQKQGSFYAEDDTPPNAKRVNVRVTAPNQEAWDALRTALPYSRRANYHLVVKAMEADYEEIPPAPDPKEEKARGTLPVKREAGGRQWRAWSLIATDEQWNTIKRLVPPEGEARTDWLLTLKPTVAEKRFPPSSARQRTLRIPATDREYETIKGIYDTNPYGRALALITDLNDHFGGAK